MAAFAWIEIARTSRVLANLPDVHASWLSASEQARLAKLRHAPRRAQYLAGHWLVRVLLVRACGGDSAQWPLIERKGLPPSVHGHGEALRISISHTEDWIAAAVATVPIGIDLEPRSRRLNAAIEPLLLNADEAPGSLPPDTLLQRWVAKEAWIKRDAGSALPERLQSLQLRAASREHADVVVDTHAEFNFGWAVAPDCRVTRHGESTLSPGAAFAITETLPPS